MPLFVALVVTGALAIAGSGTPPASLGQAAAAQARPNIVVIETDDQTLKSMRVMDNVNSLIGDRGARFTQSFVNYSLCCPSRATFLTGQYMHNHGVLQQQGAERRLQPLPGLARQQQPRRLASPCRLLHRHDRQVPERLRVPPPRAAGLVGVARGREPEGLRLHARRERHPGQLRPERRRLQAGRADPEGGRPRRPPGAEGAAVLPLAHLHGPARRRASEPEPAERLRRRREAGAAPRPRVRLRAAAEAPELQRAPTSPTSRPRSATARG